MQYTSTKIAAAQYKQQQLKCCNELYQASFFSFFFPFFSHPIYYLRPSILSPSYVVVTQIRGHIAGSSPPLPTTVGALHFYREKISALSSLVDTRRIVLTHARRSQLAVDPFFFFSSQNKFKISPRRVSIFYVLVVNTLIRVQIVLSVYYYSYVLSIIYSGVLSSIIYSGVLSTRVYNTYFTEK